MLRTDPFPTIDELGGATVVVPSADAAAAPVEELRTEEDGYADGLLRGYEDGRRQAAAEARDDLSFALRAMHAAIEDLHRADTVGIDSLAHDVIELAMSIAEAIVGREIDTAVDPGRDALVRALALAPDRGAIVARLHPADLERLDETGLAAGRDLELVADPHVSPGGCVLDAGSARIDAQVPAALARVRAELAAHDLAPADRDPGMVAP